MLVRSTVLLTASTHSVRVSRNASGFAGVLERGKSQQESLKEPFVKRMQTFDIFCQAAKNGLFI